MTKKKDTKPRGRPKSAVASDAQSILDKATWEMSKFDAKVANNMGKILDAYYDLAFNAEKENTKLTVLKELIKMQKENIEAMEAVEPHEKPREDDDGEEEDDGIDMGNILSVDFEDKKTG